MHTEIDKSGAENPCHLGILAQSFNIKQGTANEMQEVSGASFLQMNIYVKLNPNLFHFAYQEIFHEK